MCKIVDSILHHQLFLDVILGNDLVRKCCHVNYLSSGGMKTRHGEWTHSRPLLLGLRDHLTMFTRSNFTNKKHPQQSELSNPARAVFPFSAHLRRKPTNPVSLLDDYKFMMYFHHYLQFMLQVVFRVQLCAYLVSKSLDILVAYVEQVVTSFYVEYIY